MMDAGSDPNSLFQPQEPYWFFNCIVSFLLVRNFGNVIEISRHVFVQRGAAA